MLLSAVRSAVSSAVRSMIGEKLVPALDLVFAGATALDPRITFTRSTTATRVNGAGVIESVSINAPRFDYDPATKEPKGLLIEEQRTNSIRNNTMQGAVTGSPGAVPTNWASTTGSVNGITRTVVGTGVESGAAYVDIKYSGTAAGSGNISITCEPDNQVAAAQNQVWTFSCYARLVAGSFANISYRVLYLNSYTAGGGFDANSGPAVTNYPANGPSNAPLISQRYFYTGTIGSTTAVFVNAGLYFTYSAGAIIDFTIRIGLPQLELGAFATSVIPTTTTALTRASDSASMTGTNFTSWFNVAQGTMMVEAQQPILFTASKSAASISDGSNAQRFTLYRQGAGAVNVFGNPGGAIVSGPTATAGVPWKSALAYGYSPASFAVNRVTQGPLFYTVNPNVFTELAIGNAFSTGAEQFNGNIRAFKYFPRRLSDTDLRLITA